jgi:hypothetical protein
MEERMTVCRKLFGPAAAALCLMLGLPDAARMARAGSLSSSVLGMLPKNLGEVGYADLKTARQASWFPQLQAQILPLRFQRFEEFLRSAGVDPDKQVEEVVWAVASSPKQAPAGAPGGAQAPGADAPPPQKYSGEEVVGIALGSFTPDITEQFFKKQKLPSVSVRGYTLYAFGSGVSPGDLFFFFLDSNTAAFGHREMIEALIGVRFGDEESFFKNDTLSPLVEEVNGQGTLWVALGQEYAHTSIERLMPEAAQFPGATDLLGRVKGMTATLQTSSGLDAQVTPHCGSTNDAITLAQLLQAGLMYRRYQAAQNNPDLTRVIDSTSVSADGDHLRIRTQLSDDAVSTLMKGQGISFLR